MRSLLVVAAFVLAVGSGSAMADSLVVKLGTMAPEGSVWHDALLQIRQEWRDITDGELELRIFAGGVLGDEAEMVRKVQRRGLDALAITGTGLPYIDGSVDVLNVPLLFASYAELDYVRSQIAPELERHLEKRNFKVLSWSDAGWVYFFAKEPVRTPDDLRDLRLWIPAGGSESERLYKQFGFRVVPLPATDMLTALQTGLIEAIDVPPLFAMLSRSYQMAPYMTDVRWAPLNAAIVISSGSWQRIPAEFHQELLASVRAIAADVLVEIRRSGEEAIAEMQARGLELVTVDDAALAEWQREVRATYPALRATMSVPELFDEVLRLSDEFKKSFPETRLSQ